MSIILNCISFVGSKHNWNKSLKWRDEKENIFFIVLKCYDYGMGISSQCVYARAQHWLIVIKLRPNCLFVEWWRKTKHLMATDMILIRHSDSILLKNAFIFLLLLKFYTKQNWCSFWLCVCVCETRDKDLSKTKTITFFLLFYTAKPIFLMRK